MKRARTFLKTEIADAAEFAAAHGLRITLHPSGEIEMAPAGAAYSARNLDNSAGSAADRAFAEWQAHEGKASGHSFRN